MNQRDILLRVLLLTGLLGLVTLAADRYLGRGRRQTPDPVVALTAQVPKQVNDDDFVSSRTCRSCHPQQHSSWHDTYHRTMTQMALPEAIVPAEDFNRELKLQAGELTITLKRKGEEFWARLPDPDQEYIALEQGRDARKAPHVPPMVDRQIVLATGSHNMQIFWMPSEKEDGPLRLFPWVYQIKAQRWMPYEDSFVVHPDYGRPPVRWNDNCIACHTVNGMIEIVNQPPDPRVKSTVAEYGISCEACHGPGREHVQKHQNPLARYQQHFQSERDPTIVNPAKMTATMGSQVCGQCHSSFDSYGPYRAGDDVNQSRTFVRHIDAKDPASPFHDNYWKDGSIRIGGREYLGLTESPCYQRGNRERGKMSCFSCHNMHQEVDDTRPAKEWANDQLARKMQTNQACLQCHQEMANRISEHTYHPADSEGSRCYNCHMPHTSYALLGAIRNHRISSPNVAKHVSTGHPNACNLCHLDKTLKWTADYLTQWYQQPEVDLDEAQRNIAASVQMLLSGDAVQRIVVAWHMGWQPAWEASGDNWQMPLLAHLLEDPYSAVRFVAHETMKKLPGYPRYQEGKDYDFIASPETRTQFQKAFLGQWQASQDNLPTKPSVVLWNQDGSINGKAILELLEKRDDRKILLAE